MFFSCRRRILAVQKQITIKLTCRLPTEISTDNICELQAQTIEEINNKMEIILKYLKLKIHKEKSLSQIW